MHRLRVLFALFFLLSLLFACSSDDSSTSDGGTDAKVDAPTDGAKPDGGTAFDVSSAQATSATHVAVTFDAAPDPTQATTLANYSIPGVTLSGTPALTANTVTLTTSAQQAITYTVTVSNVTRSSDAQKLTVATAQFTGRSPFDVETAASHDNVTATITFDAPPNPTQATTLANYAISGLTLSGTPSLQGNTVTLTTSSQTGSLYTATVSNVTRASDGEPLTVPSAQFTGTSTFNVSSAASTGNTTMTVTFDAPPDQTKAETLANYTVPGLTLSAPSLNGSTVTLTTSSQSAQQYTVTVANVARASDGQALGITSAQFTGHTTFNVVSAATTSTTTMTVTFDSPPDQTKAETAANYAVSGLTLSSPVLAGSTVTLTTTQQSAQSYTVTVSNVTRASDSTALTTNSADFTGRAPFDVTGAASGSAVLASVTFDAPPNVSQATTLANYAVGGLALSGTPALNGNIVTFLTSAQTATSYTVTVSNVTRASDGEPLTTNQASFNGSAVQPPTVTNVVVTATSPDNGTTPYNTGTATVKLTGTDFATVTCPGGVQLDDLDGVGAAVSTKPTSCTVDSDTQITATFPSGIRTNASTGWNVQVTNTAGSNTTSSVKLVPLAGLLISEVYPASTTASHEFLELYNPTATSIDTTSNGIGVHLHILTGTGTDNGKTLTAVTSAVVPSHGFLLIISSTSLSTDAWYANRDYTYSGSSNTLTNNGGVYVSLSTTDAAKVIDKVGWGTQPAGGYEGTAIASDIPASNSVERKPAGGQGHATDSDVNSSDFNAAFTTITPRGTVDAPQP